MHIALGYRWYPNNPFRHWEQVLQTLGHTVTYVGLPETPRAGYDNTIPLVELLAALQPPPDLYWWIDPSGRYFPMGIEDLPIPTACYLVDVHLGNWRQAAAQFFDAVFIAQRNHLDSYRRSLPHPQIFHLPLCVDPQTHDRLNLRRTYDVAFVGNIARAHHKTPRARQLGLLADRYKTNDFFRVYLQAEQAQVYNQAKIVFNTSIAGEVTQRLYEATACGALVITDTRLEALGDQFELGRDLVPYQDEADLITKVDYYLNHAEERERIAENGYQRTLTRHTYYHRAQAFLEAIANPPIKRLAPMRSASAVQRFALRRKVYTHLHMLDALFDLTHTLGYQPLRRLWAIAPCLIRRLLI